MPTPSTYETLGMPLAPGTLAPGLDANGFINPIAYKVKVYTKTSDFTVLATQSGAIFNTTGATANVNFTLPAVTTTGFVAYFFNTVDFNMTVTSAEGDNIVMKNDVDLDSISFQTTSEKIGGACMLVSDGTNWMAFILSEELVTVTAAD